jgi:hypothetical protein
MKKSLFLLLFSIFCSKLFAQQQNEDMNKGFSRSNMFFGSGLNLGIASRSFNIGLNPELGFSLNNWLDVGAAVNFNYYSQNASEFSSIRFQNINYGAGLFTRIWPVNFFYIQIQPEYNWTNSSQKNVSTQQTTKYNFSAESMLVGIGYGTRMRGSRLSYVGLLIDVLQNPNSPYRDQYNDPLPVFRAGFGVYLHPTR